MGGVIDADMDTYIKAETTPNDDNDELQFFTGGVERMKILSDGKTQVVGNIVPALTNTTDLGSSTKVWKNVYTETAVVSKGVQIGNADDVSPNGTIRYINNTFQVKTNNKWYYLYAAGEIMAMYTFPLYSNTFTVILKAIFLN